MVRRRLLVERLGERRVLAAISGAVFEDADLSLQREVGESAAASRLVFIDANRNDRLDNGEPVSITGEDGSFRFEGLRYWIRARCILRSRKVLATYRDFPLKGSFSVWYMAPDRVMGKGMKSWTCSGCIPRRIR